jgi:hypothetical protein
MPTAHDIARVFSASALCCGLLLASGCTSASKPQMLPVGPQAIGEQRDFDQYRVAVVNADSTDIYEAQKSDELCWAACLRMIKKMRGEQPWGTQEDYRDRVLADVEAMETALATVSGWPSDREPESEAASYGEVVYAMRQLEDPYPLRVVIGLSERLVGAESIVESLSAGEPVLVGVKNHPDSDVGHIMLLVGADYRLASPTTGFEGFVSRFGKATVEFDNVFLFDPATDEATGNGRGFVQQYGPAFEANLDFAVSLSSVREWERERIAFLNEHDKGPGVYITPLWPGAEPWYFAVSLNDT